MAKLSKRIQALRAKVDRNRAYPLADALALVKETANAKFDESVDLAVNLGIDTKKSDQTVRGAVVLPAGPPPTTRTSPSPTTTRSRRCRRCCGNWCACRRCWCGMHAGWWRGWKWR